MADQKISQLTPTTTVDLADQYAIARGSSNFHVSYNTLKTELSVNTSSFVKTVNAVAPDSAGNVTVSLTAVETGTSASMIAYSSSGLFTEGDVWVISGESGSASGSNGDSYIYSGDNTLLRLSGPDTAANDARYVNISGDTMTGDLILNGAPTTNNQAVNKAYVDGLTTNGTDGQTIRFNGTTQTANSFLYNSGTQVAVGTTSPDAGRVFTVSDETSGNPQVQIHGGTTQATSPGLEFEGSSFGAVLWMDSTDGHFNFGARSGFPNRTRRVSAADPVDSHNLTTKQYVDSRGTTGTNGQTIRFNGTTPTANSVLFNNGTNVAVGNTSPKSTDKFTVTDGADTRVRIGRSDLSSPDRDFLELRSNFESGSILAANEHLCLSASSGGSGTICLDATTRVEFNTSLINANTQIKQVTDPTAAQDAATKNYVDTSTANSNYVAVAGDTMTGALTISETGNALVIGDQSANADTHIVIERNFGRTGSIDFTRGVGEAHGADVIIDVNQFEDLQLKYNQATDYKQGDFRIINNTTNVMEVLSTSTNVAFNGRLTNVTDPTAAQDAATKKYVDDRVRVLQFQKNNVQTATGQEILTFGTTPAVSIGTVFGTMASTGIFTFSVAGTYRIDLVANSSAGAHDDWGLVNNTGDRFLQYAGSGLSKYSVAGDIITVSNGDNFRYLIANGTTFNGASSSTTTRLTFTKLD